MGYIEDKAKAARLDQLNQAAMVNDRRAAEAARELAVENAVLKQGLAGQQAMQYAPLQNSVEQNPVILPNGQVISMEQARGLAERARAENMQNQRRYEQSIVPPAETPYPTRRP